LLVGKDGLGALRECVAHLVRFQFLAGNMRQIVTPREISETKCYHKDARQRHEKRPTSEVPALKRMIRPALFSER
jgi:hypothetical protein